MTATFAELVLPAAGSVHARLNWGRWIADCPMPHCANAMQHTPGDPWFVCAGGGGCWAEAPIVWPADPQAIALLCLARPERFANWEPGESVHQLLEENVAHGIEPPDWRDADTAVLIASQDERVVGGALLDALHQLGVRALPEGHRRAEAPLVDSLIPRAVSRGYRSLEGGS